MKKFFPIFLVGLVLGGAGTWLALRHPTASATGGGTADEKSAGPERAAGNSEPKKQLTGSGIVVGAPQPTQIAPEAKGYGRVLDPSPFVALAADADAARSAADASARELARLKALHDQGENASVQAVEAAEAAMQRDRAQLLGAQARLIAGWGRAAAAGSGLPALVRALSDGEAALVRIDLPPGEAPADLPASGRVSALVEDDAWHAVELLGQAPASDAQAQDSSYLAVWRDHPLPIGTALRATLPAPGQSQGFLLVPRSALVRHEGATFIYVQMAQGGYERRQVEVASTLPDGVAIASGLDEKDKVVVTGAQQLLAAELLGPASGADEN